jgi:hypothetical protein
MLGPGKGLEALLAIMVVYALHSAIDDAGAEVENPRGQVPHR